MKWLFREPDSDRALQLAADAQAIREGLIAPPLFRFEVTNSIRQRMVREQVSIEDARERIATFLVYPVALFGPDLLHIRALEIADDHNLRATYDAHYVALAELLACDLWTADERMVRELAPTFPFVRWIGDYPAA